MANSLINSEQVNASFQGMTNLPVVRQVGLLVGLALSIALGIYLALWSQSPNYSVLFSSIDASDASEIIQVLDQKNIDNKYNTDSGIISVDADKVHEARMAVAAEGLPHNAGGMGFELLEKEQGFGTSAFIQNARYHRAMEGELARTIMTMSAVDSARVHLALPKESAFIRDQREASASVLLKLHAGRRLESQMVAAIAHLVASSIPNMDSEQVTIVDDKGNLLSDNDRLAALGLSAGQFEYTRKVEQSYIDRVEDLLSPIVGADKVRAQVVADMDFSQVEYTKESYNPDLPAVRSEQRVEEHSNGSSMAGGVPGALSNEPPADAQAPEQNPAASTSKSTQKTPSRSTVRSTRNYELDKTISHTKRTPGMVRRLSVAVVLDNKQTRNDAGEIVSVPYTKQELVRFTSLVKDAVGFDAMRGDTVNVTNAAFTTPPPIEAAPEPGFFEQPWVWDVGKQVGVALLLAVLFFAVLRPVMRNLSKVPATRVAVAGGGDGLAQDQLTLSGEQGQRLPKPNEYESDLEMAKSMVVEEPKRVAQVVKQWVNE
jgi:flagellar M-ring protein FliF